MLPTIANSRIQPLPLKVWLLFWLQVLGDSLGDGQARPIDGELLMAFKEAVQSSW